MILQQWMCWFAFLVFLVIVEFATMGLTTIWFAGGAMIAMFAAALHAPVYLQILIFAVVSGVLLFFTRPLVVDRFRVGRVKTNAESLIGRRAIVLEEINNLKAEGRVSVEGQEWTARSTWNEVILPKDSTVVIREISGVKLIVEAIETENAADR